MGKTTQPADPQIELIDRDGEVTLTIDGDQAMQGFSIVGSTSGSR